MRKENSTRWILTGIVLTVLCLVCVDAAQALVVVFPDANLEAKIRTAIGKPTGDILDTDLVGTGFTKLSVRSASMTDLTGLEYCTDLTELLIAKTQVSDLSALTSLTKLTDL